MKFNLKKPCANCPFRTDIPPFLTHGRAVEVAKALKNGTFKCHKTLDYSEADMESPPADTDKTAHCAGALIMLDKEGTLGSNQMARIAMRLGLFNPDDLDTAAPVFDSRADFIEAMK